MISNEKKLKKESVEHVILTNTPMTTLHLRGFNLFSCFILCINLVNKDSLTNLNALVKDEYEDALCASKQFTQTPLFKNSLFQNLYPKKSNSLFFKVFLFL